jgi:hypothetical protein
VVTERRLGETGICSPGGTGPQTCGRVLSGPESTGLPEDGASPHGEYEADMGEESARSHIVQE